METTVRAVPRRIRPRRASWLEASKHPPLCLGEEAEPVLASTGTTAEDRANYDTTIAKFDSFFNVRHNEIFERARFNRRNQQADETAEQYIMALYDLATKCNYGRFESEMIRDRSVVGIRDSALSLTLQLDAELTLEKAKKRIRQSEAVREQQQTLKGPTDGNMDEIRRRSNKSRQRSHGNAGDRRDRHNRGNRGREWPKQTTDDAKPCGRYGRGRHQRDKCPARDAVCHNCQRKGHYSAQCFRKTVSTMEEEETLDTAFLDTVSGDRSKAWIAKISVCDREVQFKLDTGAEVTAISERMWQMLGKPQLQTPKKQLFGPASEPLQVLGHFSGLLSHKDKEARQNVFVVEGLKTNLLGLPSISALNLAVRVDSTSTDPPSEPETEQTVCRKFPKVFQGLGNLGKEYHIQLQPDSQPHALLTPRRVPLPLRQKVTKELDQMEKEGVISKVTEPTTWCAGMVVVPKKSGNVRICVDLKPLNKSVLREVLPLPRVDDTLAQLAGARLFSKLDANSGFWQIPLSQESRLLTTFITPMGRYCFNKLPFAISSAPEHFQRRMNELLQGLPGVLCQMDDILVFGKDRVEHDQRLRAALARIETAGVTLNPQKCEIGRNTLIFLGHVINADGIRADPGKTNAIMKMSPPRSVPELRRFMGMANQLGKFTPNLAEFTQPLRELLSKSRAWIWGPAQSAAFKKVKQELSKPTTLTLYDPNGDTKISADASSHGLGAVLLQRVDGVWKPVAYASRSMSNTEKRYAQIEKEALATTWACERFSDFILGKRIDIETDHKPLVPLLGMKHLDNLPPRVVRFRLRLDRYDYDICHVPGKSLYTADTLSRAPLPEPLPISSIQLQELAEQNVLSAVCNLPVSSHRLKIAPTVSRSTGKPNLLTQCVKFFCSTAGMDGLQRGR